MGLVFTIIVLFLDVWAVVNVLRGSSSGAAKIAWVLGIVVFPLVGFLAWYFAGPREEGAAA